VNPPSEHNQPLRSGNADTIVWIKSAVTYVVPFCVSCAGALAATRGSAGDGRWATTM
jgi:hypothetical protein